MKMRLLLLCLCLVIQPSMIAEAREVPDGYELQRLKETDGSILMPKGWYATSSGTPYGWTWSFSKDEPEGFSYATGLRIQLIFDVAKKTGESREKYVSDFIEHKRKTVEVLDSCEAQDAGLFMRKCLEVVESTMFRGKVTQFRVLYSMLWGKETDMIAVTTFGSPVSEWESVKDISRVMSEFELIGPNFGK